MCSCMCVSRDVYESILTFFARVLHIDMTLSEELRMV